MSRFDEILRDLSQAVNTTKRETSAYDTVATVTRVEGDTAWVHIAGGVDETPIKMTVDAKAGDEVQIRVGGGRAWITGNATAPPTDDTKANEATGMARKLQQTTNTLKTTVDRIGKLAYNAAQYFWHKESSTDPDIPTGAYITEVPREIFETNKTGGNLLLRSEGLDVRDGTNSLASFSATEARIGMENVAHATMTPEGLSIVDEETVEIMRVQSTGADIQTTVREHIGERIRLNTSVSVERASELSTGDVFSVEFRVTYRVGGVTHYNQIASTYFTKGTASANTMYVEDVYIEIGYDGNKTLTGVSWNTSGAERVDYVFVWDILYNGVVKAPYFTLGTRRGEIGGYSATAGIDLIAEEDGQVVVGQYNKAGTGNFVVGTGTADDERETMLSVSSDGVFVGGHSSEIGDYIEVTNDTAVSVGSTATDVVSVQLGAGSWVINYQIRFPANTSGYRQAQMFDPLGNSVNWTQVGASPSQSTVVNGTAILAVPETGTYTLKGRQNSGSNLTVDAGEAILRVMRIC